MIKNNQIIELIDLIKKMDQSQKKISIYYLFENLNAKHKKELLNNFRFLK